MISRSAILCVGLLSVAACTDLESATNLNPEGPPMIRQVRLREMYVNASGNLVERPQPVFAFGTHPQVVSEDQAHPVTSAKSVDNRLRIIMDELLVGNNLEEVACRGLVDEDSYDRVPVGATPDDIARCAAPRDVLEASCPAGPRAICICKLDEGCGGVEKGKPVGILDENNDGAADDTRFIVGSVGLRCGNIDVPINPEQSYWNPSGDQNVPAMGGFDALGPAIVLKPAAPVGAPMGVVAFLPTNTTCQLTFDPSVVDKQGLQVCAPPNGDITQGCTPGDVSEFTFKVEPLSARALGLMPNQTGVSRTNPVQVKFSAPLAADTISGIQLLVNGNPYPDVMLTMSTPDTVRFTPTAAGGFAAETEFTISVPTSVTDYYEQPLPMPFSFTFTTGM